MSRSARRGFILPTTLLVLTLLTVMLTAAFILVSAEFRMTDNTFAAARALARAQAGLQQYFAATPAVTPASTYDSTRYTLGGGYVDVVATRIAPASGTTLSQWLVRATGYSTEGALSGSPQATRTVAQVARLNPGLLYLRAALVSANPVQITGIAGLPNPIDGRNTACGVGGDTVGLTYPTGGYSEPAIGANPSGSPSMQAFAEAAVLDSTRINWPALLAGDFSPDYNVTGGTWPAPPGGYPVYYAAGNITVSGTRYGLLVATGDVTINFGATWYGVIIAGGRLIGPSFFRVRGSVITGLNNAVSPGSVGASTLPRQLFGTGIEYSRCEVNSTMATLGSMTPLRNGWIGGWGAW